MGSNLQRRCAILVAASALFWTARGSGAALPRMTESDAKSLSMIARAFLTPDGRHLAYEAGPLWIAAEGGPSTIVVRGVDDEREARFAAGHSALGAGNLQMSPAGHWIAFSVAPVAKPAGTASVELRLALVNVATGGRREIEGVREFEFTTVGGQRILLAGYPQNDGSWKLTLADLGSANSRDFAGVKSYTTNPQRSRLAWLDGQGVQMLDLATGRARALDITPAAEYSGLTWSDSGNALAVLRKGGSGTALLAFAALDKPKTKQAVFDPSRWQGFPAGSVLGSNVRWHGDDSGVFFSIQERPEPPPAPETMPNLIIWHTRDDRLPGQKMHEAHMTRQDWCFASLFTKRFVRLSDETLTALEPSVHGRYALAYDLKPYGWQNQPRSGFSTSQLRDYYLVDQATGQRKLFARGLKVATRHHHFPTFSPDGSVLVYENNDGDILAYDVVADKTRNMTADLPVDFYLEENDPKSGRQVRDGYGQGYPWIQGWSRDGAHVLMTDYYDMWALPVRAGNAINLTRDGRKEGTWYKRITLTSSWGLSGSGAEEAPIVDLDRPMLFEAFNEMSGKNGLLRRVPGKTALEPLRWEYAAIRYFKAASADKHVFMRASSIAPGDFYRVGRNWEPDRRLTNVEASWRKFQWAPQEKYLTYRNANGAVRHGVLYLPADYVPGTAYPTVVDIYKGFSPVAHALRAPFDPGNVGEYQAAGYALFLPDILPRYGDAGRAAVEDVQAGVDAAIATGIVDRERLGLLGHSYGAYETYFVVSQIDLFKAAVPIAGMTNLWSDCGGVYGERWPKSFLCIDDQPYLGVPWWEKPDVYLKNSPLYYARNIRTPLLMIHGDNDDAVPFSQAVEMFNALRGMGNQQAVLLQYVGADHNVRWGTGLVDETGKGARIMEFLNHFLKGEPAPAWWADGVSRYNGQAPTALGVKTERATGGT